MIKGLPEFNDIKNMSYSELFKLERSLKNKLKVRRIRIKREIERSERVSQQHSNTESAYDKLVVLSEGIIPKNTRLEISTLEIYLREVQKYLEKYKSILQRSSTKPKQPGDDQE